MATVVKPAANMYSAASEEADVVSQAIYGITVLILEEKAGWLRIQTPDSYSGWTPESSLVRVKAGVPVYASTGRIGEVTSIFANIYREASVTRRQPVLTLPYEAKLEIIDEVEANQLKWLRVHLPDERTGYVQSGDVSTNQGLRTAAEAIDLGMQFLGIPYLWGGTSSFGFDCSGLTQMLLRSRGIVLPRDAQQQADSGQLREVSKAEVQPGDLLYFGASGRKITHTGMYIGDGNFLQATTYQRPVVQIGRLEEPHWSKLFVAARRPK
ncbi:MAG TPA: NlpC/P60 family protein [Bryobacteraceae bacterium]|nr:NlpC/P60 family protein [Bryobacteraceae bacterium]